MVTTKLLKMRTSLGEVTCGTKMWWRPGRPGGPNRQVGVIPIAGQTNFMDEVHCFLMEDPTIPWGNVKVRGLWWRCIEYSTKDGHPYQIRYWVKANV
jgi:hypothetical protein